MGIVFGHAKSFNKIWEVKFGQFGMYFYNFRHSMVQTNHRELLFTYKSVSDIVTRSNRKVDSTSTTISMHSREFAVWTVAPVLLKKLSMSRDRIYYKKLSRVTAIIY